MIEDQISVLRPLPIIIVLIINTTYQPTRTVTMCSPSPCPRPSLVGILVRSERRVDWRRRSSLAESVSDDDDAGTGKHLNNDDDNVPARAFHNTNDEQSNSTTCRTSFSITTTKGVTFASTIKQRRIPGLADMDKEEIASLWRTPIDRSHKKDLGPTQFYGRLIG